VGGRLVPDPLTRLAETTAACVRWRSWARRAVDRAVPERYVRL